MAEVITAVLVDGGFFLKRARRIYGEHTPQELARILHRNCLSHLNDKEGKRASSLYRIFFYDCPPSIKKVHHPRRITFHMPETGSWFVRYDKRGYWLRVILTRKAHPINGLVPWMGRYISVLQEALTYPKRSPASA